MMDWTVYYFFYSYSIIRVTAILRPFFILFVQQDFKDIITKYWVLQ